jgi:PAS domain S-box-containing protein
LEVIECLLPNQNVSKEINDFFADIGKFFNQFHVAKTAGAISLVTNYEAIYLESFHKFTPLFKFTLTDIKGLVVVDKDSRSQRLKDLRDRKVIFHQNTDWFLINPVILFFIKKCRIITPQINKDSFTNIEPIELNYVLDKKSKAAVTTSFNMNLLPVKERKKLKILGEFPILPEYNMVVSPEFKVQSISKIKDEIDRWIVRHSDRLTNIGLKFSPIETEYRSLLLEAIEGIGYPLKVFIEDFKDLMISSIAVNQQKDMVEIEEKYKRLKIFNEKLVKMYQDVRDSRDRLSRDIDSASNSTILFLKDGTVLGCSRPFCTYLKYSRQDIIGKKVTRFIGANINTSFQNLIVQIDIGLVRSFFVKLKCSDGTEKDVKMEFSIIELKDSKIILGVISKNNKK